MRSIGTAQAGTLTISTTGSLDTLGVLACPCGLPLHAER